MMHREREIDGSKIRRLRNEAWMHLSDLSRETGIAVDTLSRIENGKRPYPRRSTIFAIAEALNVKPDELLLGDPLTLPEPPAREDCERGTGSANGHSRGTG